MANSQTLTLNIKALFDASDVKSKVSDIQSALSRLKLPDKLATDLNSSFTSVNKALDDFISKTEKGIKTKADASGISKSFETVTKELNKLDNLMIKVKSQLGDSVNLSNIIKVDEKTKAELDAIQERIKTLQNEIASINTSKLTELQNLLKQIKSGSGAAKQGEAALELFKQGDVDGAVESLSKIIAKLEAMRDTASHAGKNVDNVQNSIDRLKDMRQAMVDSQTESADKIAEIGDLSSQAAAKLSASQNQVVSATNAAADALHKEAAAANDVGTKIEDVTSRQAQFIHEVDQIKSRVQYFFGLANGINLVKRAIREAVETIKDLDKAMTETAVVTDFTVGEMWEQLPEYTKRANELGVTTQAAYEAATLYYQQGLNNEEVNALSVETLKMARIAGLDAAEATDRMTNALRGFNMELDTASAQRVDDVYSELAANTASNVDEISTAMTKVASLAHSANMEFETTAAFLAQIIETTRESAETAGTALKTVVARFSEVKKLVDTNQLKGQDEEGQVVDVNKVSAALRTAGIDLNKYFLGEVGLDDIFMELASKWDSLTSVQQRYIATQAAGSRQQSRFIALMQDYSRTQELVEKAYNAEGASARQFAKTQESLESKLNRLSNAWHEFLMGLTNSTIVKGFVDILTGLLNIVNKLTSAFGEGVGSVLKWVTALSGLLGLRALFSNGGLAVKGISSLLGNTALGNMWNKMNGLDSETTQHLSMIEQVKAAWFSAIEQIKAAGIAAETEEGTAAVAGEAQEAAAATAGEAEEAVAAVAGEAEEAAAAIAGEAAEAAAATAGEAAEASSSLFKGFAQTVAAASTTAATAGVTGAAGAAGAGAGAAGAAGAAAAGGVATGLLTIATALGAVLVAVGAVAAAYKIWLKTTPEGQLKTARKLADQLDEDAVNAQNVSDSYKNLQDSYAEYTAKVNEAKTTSEYEDAVAKRNEAILKAIDENPDYAQYLQTDFDVNGQLVLTLDEGQVTEAAIEAAKAATAAAIASYFAQADVSMKEAAVTAAKQQDRTIGSENGFLAGGGPTIQGDKSAATENLRQGQLRSAANYAALGYAEMIRMADMGLEKELSSGLAKTLGNIYAATGEVIEQGVLESIEQSFLDNELDSRIISAAVAESFDFSLANIDIDTDFDSFLTQLGTSSNELNKFAERIGVDGSIIHDIIARRAKEVKRMETNARANVYEKGMRANQNITPQLENYLNSLNLEQLNTITDVINSTVDSINEEAFGKLFAQLPNLAKEELTEIGNFFNNFSLDSPLQAFDQLNSKINELSKTGRLNSTFGQMLTSIKEVNAELFTTSSLVQDFFMSDAYDKLSDSLDDFIKENGRISSKNIEELAKSSSELNSLLQDTEASAKSLAEAFTLLQEGKIQIDAITEALLKALDAGKSFEEMIDDVQSWIDDFDEGTDLNFGTDHMMSEAKNLKEFVDSWQFGNEPTENIYNHLFGKEGENSYQKLLDQFGNDFDGLEKYINGRIESLNNMAENQGLGGIETALSKGLKGLTQISGKNGEFFDWDLSQFSSTTEAINSVEDALNLSQGAAEAMILSWQTHLPKLRTEWNELNYQTELQTFADAISGQKAVTEQELAALGASVGKTAEQVKADLESLRDQNGNPIEIPVVVNWQDKDGGGLSGDDLLTEFSNKFLNNPVEVGSNVTTDTGAIQNVATSTAEQYAEFLGDAFDSAAGTIDFSSAMSKLLETGLSEGQASEILDTFADTLNASLTDKIKIPAIDVDDNGNSIVTTIEQSVSGADVSGLKANIDAELQAADYQLIASKIAEVGLDALAANVTSQMSAGASAGASAISNAVASLGPLPIHYYWIADNTIQVPSMGATGGIVKSYAAGSANNTLKPGPALTGEEGPEIVWNKDKGYAYITGKNHPEFQNLRPGDRVFNAQETRKILSGAALGGKVNAYASGGWKPAAKKSSGGGGGSSSSDDATKESTWRNELDWLYDLMADIESYERQQTAIQKKYELTLEDLSSTGRDLYKLTQKELVNLQTQLKAQETAYQKRLQQMGELQTQVNAAGYGQYIQWNNADRTIEINWDAIEAIQDQDTYDEVTDWLDRMEEVSDQLYDAEEAIWDIKDQIQELQDRYLEKYLDFQDRVLDAVVAQYQQTIDNLSELNDKVNDTNSAILDSIQREIDLERQIRDNTDTEKNIADMEARLAYMQRDTTGANSKEILSLEKQLEDARQSYSDELIDQAVNRLSQANDDAAAQREKQIELMQAQLDYWQESGGLWEEVASLISTGFASNGSIITGSDLWNVLKEGETWNAMSEAQKKNWANELILETNEVGAHLIQISDGNTINAEKVRASIADQRGILTQDIAAAAETVRASIGSLKGKLGGTPEHSYTAEKTDGYASGGLNSKTGPALLHGTPSEPEYVLNARQTDAFLRLADVLPQIYGGNVIAGNTYGGDVAFNVNVNVGSIANDYDVDSLVARIKDDLYESASYRNGNVLGFIR